MLDAKEVLLNDVSRAEHFLEHEHGIDARKKGQPSNIAIPELIFELRGEVEQADLDPQKIKEVQKKIKFMH